MNNRFIDIAGTAILAIGAFLAFLPHAFHAKAGLVEDTHITHVISGVALIVLGLGILVYGTNQGNEKVYI